MSEPFREYATSVSTEKMIAALVTSNTMAEACRKLGVAPGSVHYRRRRDQDVERAYIEHLKRRSESGPCPTCGKHGLRSEWRTP